MFVDRARINVTAGAGGNGCCSFRREKYVAHGGPNGGDGGDGGDIYLVATPRHNALNHLRYHSTWKGNRGQHGQGSDMHGKNGKAMPIEVPVGTVVRERDSGTFLCDLSEEGQRYLVTRGGKGGRGNARFVSSTNRAPRFAEKGEPGEEASLDLELKLIADVGIVGLPNAGKSTLLSRVSAATPKIADYPFTTISPNLGVVELSDYRTFTLADIPGIIEGAAEGKGLGHDFLRHIERTKILLFLIDPGEADPTATLKTLEDELAQHSDVFQRHPRIVVFSKADIPENCTSFEELKHEFDSPHLISSVTGEGVAEVLEAVWQALDRYNREQQEEIAFQPSEETEYRYEAPFTIEPEDEGFCIEGRKVVRAVRMTDFDNEQAVHHLDRTLKKMGLYKALERMGAEDGQSIYIAGIELEYHSD